jgi:hypothetical protein
MNPIAQNPIESAMMEGVIHTSPAAPPAIIEL